MSKVDGNIYLNLEDEFLARNPQEQLSQFTNEELSINKFEGPILDIEDLKSKVIKVYNNPGHTKGSVSYEFTELGVVFTGDFVFAQGIGRTDLFSGNNAEMKDSINNIFLLFDKELDVLPGHGDSDTVSNILNYNDYLKEFIDD
jgi:glyoxylase-like metal-dependent hydrolase (beta-lactamase superfamily II)